MSVQPSVIIDTPDVPFSASQLPDIANIVDTNDPHAQWGASYRSSGLCGIGTVIGPTDVCTQKDLAAAISNGVPYATGYSGTVVTGVKCHGPFNMADFQAAAMAGIDARINRTVQDTIVGGLVPTAAWTTVAGGSGKAGGLGIAETQARCNYLGQPVFHMNPELIATYEGRQIIRVGRHLETVSGALVSPTCGVANTVIGITGYLTLMKGANRVLEPLRIGNTNEWIVAALTPVTLFVDCNFAVQVTGAAGGTY